MKTHLTIDDLVSIAGEAVPVFASRRTWGPDELLVVTATDGALAFSVTVLTVAELQAGGFGKSDQMRAWIESVRDGLNGVPVMYSAPDGFRVQVAQRVARLS